MLFGTKNLMYETSKCFVEHATLSGFSRKQPILIFKIELHTCHAFFWNSLRMIKHFSLFYRFEVDKRGWGLGLACKEVSSCRDLKYASMKLMWYMLPYFCMTGSSTQDVWIHQLQRFIIHIGDEIRKRQFMIFSHSTKFTST